MEDGREKIPLLDNAPEAGMSEAWRAFCKSGYNADRWLACHGTVVFDGKE